MTSMQMAWAQHLENMRAHKAQELISQQEADTRSFAAEETQRHNLITEYLSDKDLNEKIRHQQTQDAETMRHNKVSEEEIANHNRAVESIERQTNQLKKTIANMENATRLKIAGQQVSAQKEIAAAQQALTKLTAEWKYATDLSGLVISKDRLENDKRVAQQNLDIAKQQLSQDNERIQGDLVYKAISSVTGLADTIVKWTNSKNSSKNSSGSKNTSTTNTSKSKSSK